MVSGQSKANEKSDKMKQLYEVDTEKILLSNDKITIADLWKSKPQPLFPSIFLKRLDLE